MNRDVNKKCCKENLVKLQEEYFNDRIISEIAELILKIALFILNVTTSPDRPST